jgi:hypothetical protein
VSAPAAHDPRLTTGVRAGFEAFGDAAGRWMLLAVVVAVGALSAVGLAALASPAWYDAGRPAWDPAVLVPNVLLGIGSMLVAFAVSGIALRQMRTRIVDVRAGLAVLRHGTVWTVASVLGGVTAVLDVPLHGGGVLLALPFSLYTPFLLADGASAEDALRGGLRLLAVRPGQQLTLFGLTVLVAIGGTLACFVGLLVALPVISLAYAWAYCHLTRRPAASWTDGLDSPS